jgi:hypothetical protein
VTALLELAHGRFAVEAIDGRRVHRVVPVAVGLLNDAKGLVLKQAIPAVRGWFGGRDRPVGGFNAAVGRWGAIRMAIGGRVWCGWVLDDAI